LKKDNLGLGEARGVEKEVKYGYLCQEPLYRESKRQTRGREHVVKTKIGEGVGRSRSSMYGEGNSGPAQEGEG